MTRKSPWQYNEVMEKPAVANRNNGISSMASPFFITFIYVSTRIFERTDLYGPYYALSPR